MFIEGQTDKAVGLYFNKIVAIDLEVAIQKKELKIENLYNLVKILT